MKHLLLTIRGLAFVANDAARRLAAVVANYAGDVGDPSGTEHWFRLAPYGEFPASATLPGLTGTIPVVQVVDREGCGLMAEDIKRRIANDPDCHRGLPIYEGHPDDKNWAAKNPGYKRKAVGRILEMELRDDGPWVRAVFNDAGVALIKGPAAPLAAQSPNWGCVEIDGRKDRIRAVQLYSVGLVERSQIPGNAIALNEWLNESPRPEAEATTKTNDNKRMNPELLKRLGLKPDATQAEFEAAVLAMCDKCDKLGTDIAAANACKTDAEKKATDMANEAKEAKSKLVKLAVSNAVADGRISEAEKPKWTAALEADFDGESAKLDKKTKVVNTADLTAGGQRTGNPAVKLDVINEALEAHAKANGLDLANREQYTQDWSGIQSAKPELLK